MSVYFIGIMLADYCYFHYYYYHYYYYYYYSNVDRMNILDDGNVRTYKYKMYYFNLHRVVTSSKM